MSGPFDDWYDQSVAVELVTGSGGMGETYGDPTDLPCQIDETVRMVRNPEAVEVVSSTTLQAAEGTVAPPGSRITLPNGRVTKVIITSTDYAGDDPDLRGVEVHLE